MMGWTVFFFFLALLLLVICHESGHFLVARAFNVRVLRFSFGFGKPLLRFSDKKGTEYTWSLIPLGGYVKMLDETLGEVPVESRAYAFNRQPVGVRFLIVLAGPVFNFLFAWLAIALALMLGISVPSSLPIIDAVEPGTPAYTAGLMHGDKILSINDRAIKQGIGVAQFVQKHPDEWVNIQLNRGGIEKSIRMQLGHIENHGQAHGWLGVQLVLQPAQDKTAHVHRETLFSALTLSGIKTWELTRATFSFVGNIFHDRQLMQSMSGPLGIAQYAGISAHAGLIQYLLFLALVSVSLGVLNLLPIPMLDGGYLFYYMIEMIIRRPLPVRLQTFAAYLGFILLMAITVVAFRNDLVRLGMGT